MTTEARISRTWRNRQLMIAAFLIAFGIWFAYDGAFGYPAANRQYEKFEEMKSQGREGEWEEFSAKQGWPAKPPKHAYEASQIRTQFVLAGVSAVLGLGALVWLAICRKRSVRMDESAIYGDTGRRVAFDSIQGVNRKKWDSKGIAYALYEEGGKMKRLTIDDYKYAGAEAVLLEVEKRLGISQEPKEPAPEA